MTLAKLAPLVDGGLVVDELVGKIVFAGDVGPEAIWPEPDASGPDAALLDRGDVDDLLDEVLDAEDTNDLELDAEDPDDEPEADNPELANEVLCN